MLENHFDELQKKNIVIIDNFLSPSECESILFELNFGYWNDSRVINGQYNTDNAVGFVSETRKSQSCYQEFFNDDLIETVEDIEKRIEVKFHNSAKTFETWQATKYDKGGKFDFHLDCGSWKGTKEGERARTIIIYLDTPIKGGETSFRALNIDVKATAGRLLIWNNLLPNGDCNYAMIHASKPLVKGEKNILITWERQFQYRNS